jgi:hypothetical protein
MALHVDHPTTVYGETHITADYYYDSVETRKDASGRIIAAPKRIKFTFRTQRTPPKTGFVLTFFLSLL